MKKRVPSFLSGMLTMALIGSIGVTALAATGAMTITVDPINIQVNGATFQPKDAQGADVPVFAYNGTTYAPLRALAEAYGLEVGYDAGTNMATVAGNPALENDTAKPEDPSSFEMPTDLSSYEDFKALWTVTKHTEGSYSAALIPDVENVAEYKSAFKILWNSTEEDVRKNLMEQFLLDVKNDNNIESEHCYVGFIYDGKAMGSVSDYGYITTRTEDIP